MSYLVTLLLSLLIISAVVIVLSRVRTPTYRLRRGNIIALLELVLDGNASENDWNVFVSIPIRYDPELENIRLRCMQIEEREFIGNSMPYRKNRHLFTKQGLQELKTILVELQNAPVNT